MENSYRLVAVCTSRVYDTGIHAFVEGLAKLLKAQGFRLLVFTLNADQYWEEESLSAECAVFDFIPYEKLEALILMDEKIKSHRVSEGIIAGARAANVPVIVLDGYYEGCSNIRYDFRSGFESVVRHVIEDHHVQHPHFMAGIKDNPFSDERLDVFREVLAQNNMPFDDSMVSYGNFWATPARKATEILLERDELPDAIICANDIMAINVSDVLQASGIDVPGQVIVTGFDGYDEVFMISPAITTADCAPDSMSETCAEIIERCINGEILNPIVQPKLIINESCGCPRCTTQRRSTLNGFNRSFYRFQDDTRMMHDSITRMITAPSIKDVCSFIDMAIKGMYGKFSASVCCIIDKSCLSSEHYFFSEPENVNPEYIVFYDTGHEQDIETAFDIREIMPHIRERLSDEHPILIHALDYMNRCMGYVVYYLTTDITEYAQTANITEMLNLGLGGFITARNQSYLLNKVEDIYRLDALTGLFNRTAFKSALDTLEKEIPEEGLPLMILMADLDGLKNINDNLGHDAGDRAIAAIANALKTACPRNALCVRYGGDEMMALIPGNYDKEAILSRIRKSTVQSSRKEGFEISASCGTYETLLHPGDDVDELVKKADAEMYMIKKSRKR